MNSAMNTAMKHIDSVMKPDQLMFDYSINWSLLVWGSEWLWLWLGNLVSYPVHNQIHGLVPIELYALDNSFKLDNIVVSWTWLLIFLPIDTSGKVSFSALNVGNTG
mgnify:CR=1 FL=1